MIAALRPGPIDGERARREAQWRTRTAPDRTAFIASVARVYAQEAARTAALAAFDFGAKLEYSERGEAAGGYFMHPVRVAFLLAAFGGAEEHRDFVCALLHNVFETAPASSGQVAAVADDGIVAKIRALTIDRSRQSDPEYLEAYYAGIVRADAGAIKVVDKMDNLFLLHVAPDRDVRRRYIAEIRRHVVPLCAHALPAATGYLSDLIVDVESREMATDA